MDKNIEIYNRDAQRYASDYESLKTENVLPHFVRQVRKIKGKDNLKALDIACGSGRDARWLSTQGFKVLAVDGSEKMLENARAYHGKENIEFMHDIAPAFNSLSARREKFDVILISAFLFHLDKDSRRIFYQNLEKLCAPQAYIHISLRYGPAGDQRSMYDVPLSELEDFAKKHDLNFTLAGGAEDKLKRNGVSWSYVDLKR